MFDHSFSMSCMVLRPNKSNAISFASSARTLVMGVCAGNLNTWKQHFWDCKNNKYTLLCSWGFSRYSAPIHWLAHGHMTSNNAKTTTSNVKQFTVTREMLTAVARYQRVQLKVVWCCRANLSAFFKICFCFVLLFNKSLNDWYLGKQWILCPSNLTVSVDFAWGNILRKQNSLFTSGPVIKYYYFCCATLNDLLCFRGISDMSNNRQRFLVEVEESATLGMKYIYFS